MLTNPLRDRFGIVQRLEFYNVEDLATIVSRSAGILGLEIEAAGRGGNRQARAAVRRELPIACCAGYATSPRSAGRATLPR